MTEVIEVKIGDVRTTHPKAGSRIAVSKPIPPPAKIQAILGELQDLPQEAEQEAQTIAELQKKITELRGQLAQKRQGTENSVPSKEIDTAVKTALQRQRHTFAQEKHRLEARIHQLQTTLVSVETTIAAALEKPVSVAVPAEEPKKSSLPSQQPAAKQSGSAASPGAARILQALATRYPMKFTKSQLATLAHLSARGGTYQKYLTHLKAQGDITLDNGYIQLTEQGKDRAEPYTNQVTATENPIAMWQRTLSSGARRIFDVLIQTYPNTITRSDIGQQAGLSPQSGTFQKYMRMLRNNGLIELDGQQIKASKTLFL